MKTHQITDLLTNDLVVTDAGIETVLSFQRGFDLPLFAAYPLLERPDGRRVLSEYMSDFVTLADKHDAPLILETPTWRANAAWAEQLGQSSDDLLRVWDDAVQLVDDVRSRRLTERTSVISGSVGPRGDGYVPGDTMTAVEAARYHASQISGMADAGADLVTAFTFSYLEEGIGFAVAAAERDVPAVVGFTVETDGRLPTGMPLGEAIEAVDAATGGSAAWFMVNCAHPDHITAGLDSTPAAWHRRVGALRANASRQSHAELDEATELDAGNPDELSREYLQLASTFPNLRVLGGCCGTDIEHVTAITSAWTSQNRRPLRRRIPGMVTS